MRKIAVLVLMAVCLCGCRQPSMNAQRSTLRDAGDIGATIWLDAIDQAKVEKRKQQIEQTCEKVIKFLEGGQVAALTGTVLTSKLVALVPKDWQWVPADILAAVSLQRVQTVAVGSKNIKRMVAFCRGMKRGAYHYALNDRQNE